MYEFERARKFSTRILIKEVYAHFVAPHLDHERSDWDNGSEDVYYLDPEAREYEKSDLDKAKKEGLSDAEREAHKDSSACKEACNAQEDCFQWVFKRGICGLHYKKFKLGENVKRDGDDGDDDSKRVFSGWNMRRIQSWIDDQGNCHEPYKWRVQDR